MKTPVMVNSMHDDDWSSEMTVFFFDDFDSTQVSPLAFSVPRLSNTSLGSFLHNSYSSSISCGMANKTGFGELSCECLGRVRVRRGCKIRYIIYYMKYNKLLYI